MLYLTGYKSVTLKNIKKFRQLNSICAGHPEYERNTGIETTTGPLGQGISNAVGIAIAEQMLKNTSHNRLKSSEIQSLYIKLTKSLKTLPFFPDLDKVNLSILSMRMMI